MDSSNLSDGAISSAGRLRASSANHTHNPHDSEYPDYSIYTRHSHHTYPSHSREAATGAGKTIR